MKPLHLKEARDLFGVRESLETYAVERRVEDADVKSIEILEGKLLNHEN